jgi:large subunit ribosomal protein L13
MVMKKSMTEKINEQVIDAAGLPLGRVASQCAAWLLGKHKPDFSFEKDTGDSVLVKNADKIILTGKKMEQKKYFSYSGYPGKLKTRLAGEMLELRPEELLRRAVYGMLPSNSLRRNRIKRLKFVNTADSK